MLSVQYSGSFWLNNHGFCKPSWLWLANCFDANGFIVGLGAVTGLGTEWVLVPGLPVV